MSLKQPRPPSQERATSPANVSAGPHGRPQGHGETARTTLTTVQKTTQVASGVNTVGTGATGIAQASLTKEAQDAYAAASDKKGEADIYEAFIQTYQDLVDQALANLMAAQDTANAMLEAAAGGLKDRGDSMSQVRFAG